MRCWLEMFAPAILAGALAFWMAGWLAGLAAAALVVVGQIWTGYLLVRGIMG